MLNKDHYKGPADIYSFAITMYECMKWGEAYPKEEFKHEWDIADFVCKGKRLDKLDNMRDDVYSIITECWCEEPKERLEIDEVVKLLELL